MRDLSNNNTELSESPKWSSTTKLIVGLSIVAILALLLMQLRMWIGLFILSFILAYLLYPISRWMNQSLKLSWSLSVGLIYLVTVILVLGLLTWGGISFVDPVQNLFKFIQKTLNQLPDYLDEISQQSYSLGPLTFDFSTLDFNNLTDQLLGLVQPIISQTGSIIGTVATGAATVLWQVTILLLISYFILSETKGAWDKIISIKIPGYQEDIRNIGRELGRIWNAFLRGQLILMFIAVITYTIVLSILGVRFAFGLALMAGVARFVPYVGPWLMWITYFLVALLQGSTIFGLDPLIYAIIVDGMAFFIDTFMDNFIAPRIYANTLRVHPAAVLVAILVSAAWFGFIGIVLAAPVLATIKLFWNYAWLKMVDQNPWDTIQATATKPASFPTTSSIRSSIKKVWEKSRTFLDRLKR